MSDRLADLRRIESALETAGHVASGFTRDLLETTFKSGDDPVTAADLAIDETLRRCLPEEGEGWLSEETVDDAGRLSCRRVWVVDPLDGTREFVEGIPEWCISVGLVENGRPVAGGVLNPASGTMILGAEGVGVSLDGRPAAASAATSIRGALILASRSEVKRGEWDRFFSTPISVRNMGSVAYKLALVAAGVADGTWTLVPKHEWDVAAGAALVLAGGGWVETVDGGEPRFNQKTPWLPGFVAGGAGLRDEIKDLLRPEVN